MCFSASASFITSGGLALIGGASVKTAKGKQKILAAIPFVFSIQQALEGVQWLALRQNNICSVAGYGYLFFALMVWPIYIPVTVFILDKKRARVLRWFVGLGAGLSLFFFVLMLTHPLDISIIGHSIAYWLGVPFEKFVGALYLAIVCGALFVSSKPAFRGFGVLILVSAVISVIYFYAAFASVWCFFAAIISSLIYLYLRYLKRFE